jgi:hypothetical protein
MRPDRCARAVAYGSCSSWAPPTAAREAPRMPPKRRFRKSSVVTVTGGGSVARGTFPNAGPGNRSRYADTNTFATSARRVSRRASPRESSLPCPSILRGRPSHSRTRSRDRTSAQRGAQARRACLDARDPSRSRSRSLLHSRPSERASTDRPSTSWSNGVDEPIGAGEAVFLHEGEEHEMKSEAGLTALIIEGESLDRFRERPTTAP